MKCGSPRAGQSGSCGFSLIELLVVMGVISVLLAAAVPAINGLQGGGEFTRGVDELALVLRQARAHAVSRNTYVWVGISEESASGGTSSQEPPFSGKGQVVLATVASVDGTRILEDGAEPAVIPSARLRPVGRVQKIPRIHLADVGAPTGAGDAQRLEARPEAPYTGDGAERLRVSSESALKAPHPFQVGGYTFYKTIRFSPSGEVTLHGASAPGRLGEIGILPARGDQVLTASPNRAAVQIAGLSGNVRVYRR